MLGGSSLNQWGNRGPNRLHLFMTGEYKAKSGKILDPAKYASSANGALGGYQYYQNDYAHVYYGSGTLATCGCGPTSFAMVASTLKKQKITPKDAVQWCKNRYYISGSGTSWTYFEAAAKHFGITIPTATGDSNKVVSALKNGKMVISSQSSGLFTKGGHFIVLSGINSSGGISVKDPNKANAVDRGYNNRTFTIGEIKKAALQYWIF